MNKISEKQIQEPAKAFRTYKIDNYANFWSCTVEVEPTKILEEYSKPDEPYTTLMLMKELILFWHGGASRLDLNNGDITKTFLQQLGREIFIILCENNYNLFGVVDEFKGREGWPLMDGRVGIKITDVDTLDFECDDFEIEQI